MAPALPKIETQETPTQQMVRESNPVRTVTDSLGRLIRYKNLTILERAKLARAVGEYAGNPMYWGMVTTAAAIIDIDGDIGPPKTKPSFLESRLEWLRDEGWVAVILDDRERADADDSELSKAEMAKN